MVDGCIETGRFYAEQGREKSEALAKQLKQVSLEIHKLFLKLNEKIEETEKLKYLEAFLPICLFPLPSDEYFPSLL